MKRQILIGIVLAGIGAINVNDLSIDQLEGLLNEEFAHIKEIDGIKAIILTDKGKKIYQALDAVVGIGTQW